MKKLILWTRRHKSVSRAAAICAAAAILCGALFTVYKCCFEPQRHRTKYIADTLPLDTPLTNEQAVEDIEYIYDRVSEVHPAWVDGSDELCAAFEESRQTQHEFLADKDSVTVLDVWHAAAAMTSVLHDAHTSARVSCGSERVLECVSAADLTENAVLVSAGGRSVDGLFDICKNLCSYERETWAKHIFSVYLTRESGLRFLGIDTSGNIAYEYSDEKSIKTAVYRFAEPDAVSASDASEADGETPFVYYEIDEENSLGTLTILSCDCNDLYLDTLESFFNAVSEHNIKNVAVDLRDNGGGNSYVANAFIAYLDTTGYTSFGGVDVRLGSLLRKNKRQVSSVAPRRNTFSGNVYVMTSEATFSSALDFAVMISDNKLGTIVGETPGGMPTSYGDVISFQAPNSGVIVGASYKKFHRIDRSLDEFPLVPDVECSAQEAPSQVLRLINE